MYERLKRASGPVAKLAAEVADQFGDTDSARQNMALVRNRTAALDDRKRALQTLATQRRPQLVAELPNALDDPALRLDAIRAIAAFDDEGLGKLLIERYPTFSPRGEDGGDPDALGPATIWPDAGGSDREADRAEGGRAGARRPAAAARRRRRSSSRSGARSSAAPPRRRPTPGIAGCSTTRRCPPRTCRTDGRSTCAPAERAIGCTLKAARSGRTSPARTGPT